MADPRAPSVIVDVAFATVEKSLQTQRKKAVVKEPTDC